MRLKAFDAINYAQIHDVSVCSYNSDIEAAREDWTADEAHKAAVESDPWLFYLDVPDLTPNEAWERYVGNQSVAQFLRFSGISPEEAVSAYVADYPDLDYPRTVIEKLLLEYIDRQTSKETP
jgi:hypothetical protein